MKITGSLVKNAVAFGITPVFFVMMILFVDLEPGKPAVTTTLATAILMAVFWITEAIPLPVTSLFPVVLFPLLGIMDGKDVSGQYFNEVIFLFLGGFIVALAMERWDLHKRIALRILMFTGISPARILIGFMLSSAFLSMWISNTATVMILIPILISVINKLEDNLSTVEIGKYSAGLLLGTAYSASVGGIATLVGTPPNQVFIKIFDIMFPQAPEISFTTWLFFGFPTAVMLFIFIFFYLYFSFRPAGSDCKNHKDLSFSDEHRKLGPVSREQKIVFIIFVALALLWITRPELDFGSIIFPGWASVFKSPDYINDGTVAIAIALLLYIIPARGHLMVMDWEASKKLPWGVVLLFGGGFALAAGFKESGLSDWIGEQMTWLSGMNPFWVILSISLLITFLTELTSNTATTQMALPVLAALSVGIKINPILLMIPATIAASQAFMLPVATPPNAIVFGTGRLKVAQMARAGFIINLVGALILTLLTYWLAPLVFGFDMGVFPEWAK